jgi:serine/threonine-protein kinase
MLPLVPVEGAHGIQYHLGDLLGEGGQGWVYRAGYDEPDGPWIVVKMLRPDIVNDEALARFLREADVLKKLAQSQAPCPNVVRFYDHGIYRCAMGDGETYALPFIVLEYVHGTNLGEILAKTPGKGLRPGRVRRLFRQIARALSLVHDAQIIHRDLKPSNLLVTAEGGQEIVKVSDFGLVKRFDVDVKGTVALAGASLGYAPPEQFEMGNKRVSARTDLFSFAAVLFESLTSTQAFPGKPHESPFQVLSRVLSGARPQLGAVASSLAPDLADRPDLVAAIDREIARATAPDPGDRHATIFEFWDIVDPLMRAAADRIGGGTARIAAQRVPSSDALPAVRASMPAPGQAMQPSVMPQPSMPPIQPSMQPGAPMPQGSSRPESFAPGSVRVVSSGLLPEAARAISVAPHARIAFALTRSGLFRFEGGQWRPLASPGVDLAGITGLLATPAGEVVLYGERGVLVGVGPEGAVQRWASAVPEVTWTAASLHPTEILLVGEMPGRRTSLLGFLRPGQPLVKQTLDVPAKLMAAARLAGGAVLVCGESGELFTVGAGGPQPIAWGRTGHLYAVAAAPDGGAHVVGSGGHALLVTPGREARLEPVETTRDLLCVAAAPNGTAIAGGAAARLVRRSGKGWVRIPLPGHVQSAVRAVQIGPSGLLAVLDDGVVIEAGV